jgi:hypothetical protein
MAVRPVLVRLHQHPDFDQLVIATAATGGMPEWFVEKDYWVTELLRGCSNILGGALIFKGGTSLSKGWKLLDRFSEDIDLLINPQAMSPPWQTSTAVDNGLKRLAHDLDRLDGIAHRDRERSTRGSSRTDSFTYPVRFPEPIGTAGSVILLEPGIHGGYEPTTVRSIVSLIAENVATRRLELPGVEGIEPFSIALLGLRRTFVEKLFAVHNAASKHRSNERVFGRDARHFADLHALAGVEEVAMFVGSDEYRDLVIDVENMNRRFFSDRAEPPPDLRFAESEVFPDESIIADVAAAYERECARLFFGGRYPSFDAVQGRLVGMRDRL